MTHAGQMSNFKDNLWQHLRSDYKQLCWYTNSTTDIKTWFFPKSEGSYSLGDSTVFWYGIEELDNAKSCVNQLINPPSGAGVKASTRMVAHNHFVVFQPPVFFSTQRASTTRPSASLARSAAATPPPRRTTRRSSLASSVPVATLATS